MKTYIFAFIFGVSNGIEEIWMDTIPANTLQEAWDILIRKEQITQEEDLSKSEIHQDLLLDFSAVHISLLASGDPGALADGVGTHTQYYPTENNAYDLLKKITYNS